MTIAWDNIPASLDHLDARVAAAAEAIETVRQLRADATAWQRYIRHYAIGGDPLVARIDDLARVLNRDPSA